MTHRLIKRLLFYPLATALVLALLLPTLIMLVLVARGTVPFMAGWFFQLTTISAGGLLWFPAVRRLRGYCSRIALNVLLRRYWRQRQRLNRRLASGETRLVRQLQQELRLNEHGTIRALRYLRQGYGERHVRNLFAPVVRKS